MWKFQFEEVGRKAAALTLVGLVYLPLVSCDELPWSATTRAHVMVKAQLTDPSSAQFRNEFSGQNGAICGEVNARNRLGGYNGFAHYVAVPSEDRLAVDQGPPDFAEYYRSSGDEANKKVGAACLFIQAWQERCSENLQEPYLTGAHQCKLWNSEKAKDHENLKAEVGAQ